jgi:predicted nucleic acid-binding protein
MLVVADSSPLIVLINIGQIEILPNLFVQVVIPPAVAAELAARVRPQAVRDFAGSMPPWLKVQRPAVVRQLAALREGETEALSLAIELHAELVLIDERKAYRQAVALGLNAVGTVRVLERAADCGLLNLRDAFDALKRTNFWISHTLLDQRLRLWDRR